MPRGGGGSLRARHSGETSSPSSRRKPGSILIFGVSRGPTHVRVYFRPPSWRPSYFLLLAQKKPKKKAPSRPRSRAHPCARDFASRLRGLLRAPPCALRKRACIRARAPSGFSFACSPRPRGAREEQSAAVPAAEAAPHICGALPFLFALRVPSKAAAKGGRISRVPRTRSARWIAPIRLQARDGLLAEPVRP